MDNIAFQYELRPELPNVYGTTDYKAFRDTICKIDEILYKSGLEHTLVKQVLNQYVIDNKIDRQQFYKSKKSDFHYKKYRFALRCNIARHLTGESYRLFSIHLADSTLLQWFTGISVFGCIKAISKSTLERYEKCFDEKLLSNGIRECIASLSSDIKASEIGLNLPIDNTNLFMDSTCVKSHIHFPVDWVLLRDAVRSLLSAIQRIREHGLKNRMIEPNIFLKQMNRLCIAMTHTRRRVDSKKQRKLIFRKMKRLSQCIERHGNNYRKLLSENWENTIWTKAQTNQVIRRLDLILEQLPKAIKQAHERIIGERMITSKNKILSLYDRDAHIIIRGKAESEVEFGQGLLITEQVNGLIIDWKLFAEQPPSDSRTVESALAQIEKHYGRIKSICFDQALIVKETKSF